MCLPLLESVPLVPRKISAYWSFLLILGLVVKLRASPLAAQPEVSSDPATRVLVEIQSRYGALRAFRAGFEQRYFHRVQGREERSRGQLAFARANRMRIDYERPTRRVVVSDGARLLAYEPEPSPGHYYEQPVDEDALPLVLGIWMGTSRLESEFDARLLDTAPLGFVGSVVELRPRQAVALYERVLLYVDRNDARRGRVHRMMILDHAGNTNRFDFRRQEENPRLPASLFTFRPPAAAERIEI